MSGKKWDASYLDKDLKLSDSEQTFILWIEQQYMLLSRLPTFEESEDAVPITLDEWQRCWLKREVREALITRGVKLLIPGDVEEADFPIPSQVLSAKQLELVNILCDPNDQRTDKKKCEHLQISTRTFNNWMADPVFKAYYDQRTEGLLKAGSADANRALLDLVRSSDLGGIKYYNELTGRYRPQDPQTVNFKAMLAELLDILATILTPEQMKAVQGSVKNMLTRNGIVSALDDGTVREIGQSPVGKVDF